jgi:hypothetical protein
MARLPLHRAVLAGLLVAAVAPIAASGSSATVISASAGPKAIRANGGAALWIPLRYQCQAHDRLTIRLDVYQQQSNALGQAKFSGSCTGKPQRASIKVAKRGKRSGSFTTGFAMACSVSTTQVKGRYDDLKGRCNGIAVT